MTTEKMFPAGFVPGKDESGKYVQLYSDPKFTLADRINAVDLSVLTEDAILGICKRNSFETGVGLENPDHIEPVEKREFHARNGLDYELRNLHSREVRFREALSLKQSDIPAAYKALRVTFVTALGLKVALEVVKQQLAETSPEERKRQKAAYEAREKALQEKVERREKIWAIAKEHPGFVTDMRFDEQYYIERYSLTDADLKEIDEMVEEEDEEERKRANIPSDHIEHYDWRDGYYGVPIIAEKIKKVRKAAGLNQRDFARLIGYPNANKYAKFEKGELGSPTIWTKIELIRDVCDATGANPYWLETDREETVYDVDEEITAKTVDEADTYCTWPMYATHKLIREWWAQKQKVWRHAKLKGRV